jgi:hypothetical protein
MSLYFLAIVAFSAGAVPVAEPTVSADAVLDERIAEIEKALAEKNYPAAVQAALKNFGLNPSACRGIETRPINVKDESGSDIVAHTRLDQVVVIDPRQPVMKSARYLVSVLAHEMTHCEQNQQMYALALANDPALATLRGKLTQLRALADLEDVANVAAQASPAKAEAAGKFKAMAARHGLAITPEALLEASRRVVVDIQSLKRTLAELHEMEASLRAFELPGVLKPPKAGAKPSEEFQFQYNFLMLTTNKLVRTRQLQGAEGGSICKMSNFVPFEMTLQHERNCVESIRLLQTYFTTEQASPGA